MAHVQIIHSPHVSSQSSCNSVVMYVTSILMYTSYHHMSHMPIDDAW